MYLKKIFVCGGIKDITKLEVGRCGGGEVKSVVKGGGDNIYLTLMTLWI